jgi:hypothetical protein
MRDISEAHNNHGTVDGREQQTVDAWPELGPSVPPARGEHHRGREMRSANAGANHADHEGDHAPSEGSGAQAHGEGHAEAQDHGDSAGASNETRGGGRQTGSGHHGRNEAARGHHDHQKTQSGRGEHRDHNQTAPGSSATPHSHDGDTTVPYGDHSNESYKLNESVQISTPAETFESSEETYEPSAILQDLGGSAMDAVQGSMNEWLATSD